MYILGIDTSFDDTAAAVTQDTTILSNVLSTELDIHQAWGGVVPSLARASHIDHIDPVIALALKRAGLTMKDIDAVAVTFGPGLAIALEIGIDKAKKISQTFHKRLIAVNHMEGHLLSFLAQQKKRGGVLQTQPVDVSAIFPAMGVLVSGGHTEFVLVSSIGTYEIVGETQDDALGEAFDKVGRMLGLGYPAGALIEKLAKAGHSGAFTFPVPMRQVKNANTSYSGLKTAASRMVNPIIEKQGKLTKQQIADFAYAFQDASLTHLMEKLTWALDQYPVKSIILGGGVAANLELRKRLRQRAKQNEMRLYTPSSKKLCVDNAAMIAIAGYFNAQQNHYLDNLSTLDRVPNLRLGTT